MKTFIKSLAVGALIVLAGCQSVSTTSSGAVGVDRQQSMVSMLSEQEVNKMSADAYQQVLDKGRKEKTLNQDTQQVERLRAIADRLIPQVKTFRSDAVNWDWEVNLLTDKQLNAYCMPGGKIMFYTGILDELKLTDDEVAAIMGHEMAHALREHGREAMSRAYVQQLGLSAAAVLLGANQGTMQMADMVVNYAMTLPNSRTNEVEADLIGLELMARAGYDPNAAVTLWEKMASAGGSSPPEFLSTHPANNTRITGLKANIPKVEPLRQKQP